MTTRRAVLRLIGGAAAAALARPARAAGSAGLVVGVYGACVAEAGGQQRPLRLGAPVNVGDTLVVPDGARLKVRMSDGSILSLASGTRLAVAEYRSDAAGNRESAELSLAQGLLRAVVTRTERPAKFEVATAVGTGGVRGTDWFIEARPGSAQVGVLSGSVALTSAATGRSVVIPSRWGGRLEAGRDPVMPRVWAPSEFDAVIARTDVK